MTDLDDFENAFKNAPEESDKAFMGSHADALKSLQAMSQSEIDAINGMVPELGRHLNIPTPYNDVVTAVVKAREQKFPS